MPQEKQNGAGVSRRQFIQGLALASGGAVLAACAPKTVTEEIVVKETVMVEGESEVVEKVVTATPPPEEAKQVHYTTTGDIELQETVLMPLVEERTENIELTVDLTPWGSGGWDTYGDNLITRIAGGEGLDLIHIAIEGVPLLTEKNILQPLDPYLDADIEFKQDVEEDIHPVLMGALSWKGKQMELPTDWNNMVIHYNYKIFEELGMAEPEFEWTWDDFVAVAQEITDVQGTEDDRYGFNFWDSQFGMSPWYHNNDTSPFKNEWADSNMDDPKVAETLQFLADLVLEHGVAPNPGGGFDESAQFYGGHLGMRGCGGWCISGCNSNEFYDYKLQYYPHNQGPLRTVVGVGGDGMATMARHPDAAWEVLKIVNGKDYCIEYMKRNGSPQARRSVVETSEFQDRALPAPADMDIFYESLDYADYVPSPPNFNVIDPLLMRWYSQIWNGEISVEEAVQGAHEELQAEMDKLKE